MLERVRQWANQHGIVVIVAMLLVLLLFIWLLFGLGQGPPPVRHTRAEFYDVVTGKIFEVDLITVPPVASPEGNEGVRIRYFSCTPCTAESRFVGYYEKYTPETKPLLEKDPYMLNIGQRAEAGRMVSADAKVWVLASAPEGQGVVGLPWKKCPNKVIHECQPGCCE